MISKCFICDSNINRNRPGVQCSGCRCFYHANAQCSELKKDQSEIFRSMPGVKWLCQSCRTTSDNGSDNDRHVQEVRRSSLSRRSIIGNDNVSSGSSIENELRLLRESVSFCSDKISDFESTLKQFSTALKNIEGLKVEQEKIKTDVIALSNKLNDLEQFSRNKNLEIHGVPELKNENLLKVFENICAHVNFDVNVDKVDYIHRIQNRNTEHPKPILIRFTSRLVKENMLGAVRVKQHAEFSKNKKPGLWLVGAQKPIFINENLTSDKKRLYKEARQFAKEKRYKFVWVRNGNIFLRKDETSKIQLVDCPLFLKKLENKN